MTFRDSMIRATRDTFRILGEKAAFSRSIDPAERFNVILNPSVALIGDFGTAVSRSDQLKIQVEDIPEPKKGDTFTFDSTGKVYRLVDLLATDNYYTSWSVSRG